MAMFVCWLPKSQFDAESIVCVVGKVWARDVDLSCVPELRVKGGDAMPAFLISLRRVNCGLVMEGIGGLSSVFPSLVKIPLPYISIPVFIMRRACHIQC